MVAMIIGTGYLGLAAIAIIVGLLLWSETEREMFRDNDWPHLE